VALIASCLTVDYGDHLTDEVARKMHGNTVHENAGAKDEELMNEKAVTN